MLNRIYTLSLTLVLFMPLHAISGISLTPSLVSIINPDQVYMRGSTDQLCADNTLSYSLGYGESGSGGAKITHAGYLGYVLDNLPPEWAVRDVVGGELLEENETSVMIGSVSSPDPLPLTASRNTCTLKGFFGATTTYVTVQPMWVRFRSTQPPGTYGTFTTHVGTGAPYPGRGGMNMKGGLYTVFTHQYWVQENGDVVFMEPNTSCSAPKTDSVDFGAVSPGEYQVRDLELTMQCTSPVSGTVSISGGVLNSDTGRYEIETEAGKTSGALECGSVCREKPFSNTQTVSVIFRTEHLTTTTKGGAFNHAYVLTWAYD